MTGDTTFEGDFTAALAGDQNALARLLMAQAPRLAGRIRQRLQLNPFADFGVEDVLQEVFLDIIRGIRGIHCPDVVAFAAWCAIVADRRLAKMLRDRSRKKRLAHHQINVHPFPQSGNSARMFVEALANTDEKTASALAERRELIEQMRCLIDELGTMQRQAVQIHLLDERSLDSTARVLEKSPGAIRGLIHRAQQALRAALRTSSRWVVRR